MERQKNFINNLLSVQDYLFGFDNIIKISVAYTGVVVITFAVNMSLSDIHRCMKEYGIEDYDISDDERRVFLYKN
jgi:hypothetical protein